MKTLVKLSIIFLVLVLIPGCKKKDFKSGFTIPDPIEGKYTGDWDSFNQHQIPEWIKDAKFGIYAHWGLYSIPAFNTEWYGGMMYQPHWKEGVVYKHHMEAFGGPAKFGNKDFIPMFTADKFNPGEWADIIEGSGAKFAGICVIHHDGFAMWDSKVNRWNAGNMGPKKDLYGELVQSLRKKNLRTVATFHHYRTFDWYLPKDEDDIKMGIKEKWDLFDPEYRDFYWNHFTSTKEEFEKQWEKKIYEVIVNYFPDLILFDGGSNRDIQKQIFSYYFNKAAKEGKEVDVLNKYAANHKYNFPVEFGILSYEGGRDRKPESNEFWIDDLPIGRPWGYTEPYKYVYTTEEIIIGLIDRVSRNGALMLSLAPKADGSIPDKQKEILNDIGDWLKINGEAIYGSRPWKIFGEGPTQVYFPTLTDNPQEHARWEFEGLTSTDIRFTRNKENTVLYAIVLDWPEDREVSIKNLNSGVKISEGVITNISLLGSDKNLKWDRDREGLYVIFPEDKPCNFAYVLKIQLSGKLLSD